MMSMMVAPDGPVVAPLGEVATALEKVTVPKLAKGTSELPSSKSSTIHSAFCSQRAAVEVSDLVTVWPVLRFWMTALPDLVVLAVTVSLI